MNDVNEINIQAFRCEMRSIPQPKMKFDSEKLKNVEKLTPAEQSEIAALLYLGEGVTADKKTAREIWKKADNDTAHLYLSADLFRTKKLSDGFKMLQKAANEGNKTAQLRFAYCLLMGIGTEANLDKAYKIFDKLAHEKIPCAVYFVGAIQLMPTQNFITPNKERAQEKLMWSVKNGCKFALFEQGAIQYSQAKNQSEKNEAYALIKKAAEQNEVRALLYYAVSLAKGEDIKQDLELAEKYLQRCIELGFEPAIEAMKESIKKI